MQRRLFVPADILLPKQCDMTLWSTVACDQFTSDTKYWDHVSDMVRDVKSTFYMIFPEAYLEQKNHEEETARINRVMSFVVGWLAQSICPNTISMKVP